MLEERHQQFAIGAIHGRTALGTGKNESPSDYVGALVQMKCDCDDMAKWAELEADQEHVGQHTRAADV